MKSPLKKLAGQTVIYGLPTIVSRFLNYLLVPFHTQVLTDPSEYGVITQLYAYIAFLVVILTYGMETTYFKFADLRGEKKVFSTALSMLLATSGLFFFGCYVFQQDIANFILLPQHPEYIVVLGAILATDALSSIFLARLRNQEKAKTFALINVSSILINIGFNLLLLGYFKQLYEAETLPRFIASWYNPNHGIYYILFANLAQAIFKIIASLISSNSFWVKPSKKLVKELLFFGIPILVIGLMGIINETADRVMLKYLLPPGSGALSADYEIGIYGANYKLAMMVSLLIQAFRFASEPFFFKNPNGVDKKKQIAQVLTYFTAISILAFLMIAFYIDYFKYFLRKPSYWSGLNVVPVLLMANVFLGISVNVSIWYKLSGKLKYGLYVAAIGAVITLVGNAIFIPLYGYEACAVTTLICYMCTASISYYLGKKHYPIPYAFNKIVLTIFIGVALYFIGTYAPFNGVWSYCFKFLLILGFIGIFTVIEKRKILNG